LALDPLVFALVLAAAVLHASWNALVKAGGDRLAVLAMVNLAPAAITIPLLCFVLPPMSWEAAPWLALSTVCHLVYYVGLLGAYRHGDLSQVYPIARGSAPALVALGAWLLAGETLSALSLCALALLSSGLMALAWRRRRAVPAVAGRGAVLEEGGSRPSEPDRRAVLFALLTGVSIAGYSVSDGMGVRASGSSFTYIAWLFSVDCLPLVLFLFWRRGAAALPAMRLNWRKGLAGGLIAAIAYGTVIWAMNRSAMAQVVALRETSVLFATLIGTWLLHEPFGRRRLAAAVVIVAGAILLQLGKTS
jgi:drug/metabolite transporter (DMT)-like permease